jgi:hypothetical protein
MPLKDCDLTLARTRESKAAILLKSERGSNAFHLHTAPVKHEFFQPTSHEGPLWILILINRLSGAQATEWKSGE